MNAYLIDPFARTVTEVAYEAENIEQIAKLVDCETFDFVRTSENGDGMYVDDEGLLKDPSGQAFFIWKGYGAPLAGKVLFVGTNFQTGETVAPKTKLDHVKKHIVWVGYADPSSAPQPEMSFYVPKEEKKDEQE
jgi:hypothetical protein